MRSNRYSVRVCSVRKTKTKTGRHTFLVKNYDLLRVLLMKNRQTIFNVASFLHGSASNRRELIFLHVRTERRGVARNDRGYKNCKADQTWSSTACHNLFILLNNTRRR